jgi:hypothetical protein
MMRAISLAVVVGFVVGLLGGCGGGVNKQYRPAAPIAKWDNSEWAKVLVVVVTPDGFVKWDKLKANEGGVRDGLYRYVGQLGAVSPENRPELFATKDDVLAYWINAYNAICMYRVIERGYPSNILGALPPGGIFFTDTTPVGGKSYSLDSLEKSRIRSSKDARIHYAVNCMSFSCPPLLGVPYEGATLDAQLTAQARRGLNDYRCIKVMDADTVEMSSIFTSFYSGDFYESYQLRTGKKAASLVEAIAIDAGPESPILKAKNIKGMGYDWSRNEPPR